jgi:hypothetical protein
MVFWFRIFFTFSLVFVLGSTIFARKAFALTENSIHQQYLISQSEAETTADSEINRFDPDSEAEEDDEKSEAKADGDIEDDMLLTSNKFNLNLLFASFFNSKITFPHKSPELSLITPPPEI